MNGSIFHMNPHCEVADVGSIDEYGRTKLHFAANYGITNLANYLLAEGADIDAQDNNGWSALHFAAQCNHFDMVDLLLAHNANPNLCDNQGNTPLWTATINSCGKYRGVISLLKAEANPFHKNHYGLSPKYISSIIEKD